MAWYDVKQCAEEKPEHPELLQCGYEYKPLSIRRERKNNDWLCKKKVKVRYRAKFKYIDQIKQSQQSLQCALKKVIFTQFIPLTLNQLKNPSSSHSRRCRRFLPDLLRLRADVAAIHLLVWLYRWLTHPHRRIHHFPSSFALSSSWVRY